MEHYISKNQKEIYNKSCFGINKGDRLINDTDKEELKLSLRIAKNNLAIDTKNKYYQEEVNRINKDLWK